MSLLNVWNIKAGSEGAQILLRDRDGERLLRSVQPLERIEVGITQPKRSKKRQEEVKE